MPPSVERALANSLADHPDVAWTPPPVLPAERDLEQAIAIIDGEARTGEKHAAWCLARLVMAFEPNTRLTADETRLRLAVWLEANGDLGDELWSAATIAALKGSQWMPKPAEFRRLVQARFDERHRRLQHCRSMLDRHRRPARSKAFVPEPLPVRLRGMRDTFRRLGNVAKAVHYERQLADMEKREPEPWASGEARAP